MTGPIRFQSSSLPKNTNMQYLCGIDAFADGGTMKGDSASNVILQHAASKSHTHTQYAQAIDDGNGYGAFASPTGATNIYLRTPQSGIIPFQNGGHGYVGTSNGPFKYIYGQQIFDNGNRVLTLAGGTITGQIYKTNNNCSGYEGRDCAVVRSYSANTSLYYPIFSSKSLNGSGDVGCLGAQNNLYFSYVTDTNYNASNNVNTFSYLRNTATGQIYTGTMSSSAAPSSAGAYTCHIQLL